MQKVYVLLYETLHMAPTLLGYWFRSHKGLLYKFDLS